MGGFAWVTLATNDSYSLGALVLAHSLRRVGTKHDLAVLITPGVTDVMREKLSSVYDLVQEVNVLDSKDEANLALLARPELGITFTKLHCWRLTQYDKCVFIDADALVMKNSDELFEREELSAAPDVGWPDCFNSGVFVFKPSQQTFASLTSHATAQGSFDGGDQGLLNSFFSDWAHKDISKHLPFIYNMCSTATYSYLPAFKQFGEDVKIIHFIGSTKPWLQYFDTLTGQVQPAPGTGHLQPLLQHWWNIFCDNVHPELSPVMAGIAGALAKITLGEARTSEQVALEEHMRKYGWEQGKIDYMGRDSFDNIWKKISTTLDAPSPKSEKTPVKPKSAEKVQKKPAEKIETVPTTESPPKETKISAAAADEFVPENQGVPTAQESKVEKFAIPVIEAKELMSTPTTTTTTTQPSSPEISSEPILALKAAPPILSIKESGEKIVDNKSKLEKEQQQPSEYPDEPKTPTPGEIIPLGFLTTPELPAESQSLASDSESSVPIQVAELVLQADIKESVSEDTTPVSEEIISSIPDEPAVQASPPVRSTGSEAPILPSEKIAEPNEKLEIKSDTETPAVDKSISETLVEEAKPPVPEESPQVPEIISAKAETISTDEKIREIKTQVPDSPQESTEAQTLIERTETKDIKIPATPTIIEATPPTSPQFETTEDEVTAPKKIARKVVKKVVKKTKESQDEEEAGAAEGTSEEKSKKTVKVVKKTTELNENLEPDTFAPETPPPTSMNPPTPPKRKSKTSATTKTTTKKSESDK